MLVISLEWLTGGFDPIGVDALVLLATIVVLALTARSVIGLREEVSGSETIDAERPWGGQPRSAGSAPAGGTAEAVPVASAARSSAPVAGRPSDAGSGWAASNVLDGTLLRPLGALGAASALVFGLILVWLGQRLLLGVDPGVGAYVVWFAGLLLLVLLCSQAARRASWGASYAEGSTRSNLASPRRALVLAGIIGVASVYIWLEARDREPTDSSLDLVVLWFASLVALIIAATGLPRRDDAARLRAWVVRVRGDLLITLAIIVLALFPRIFDLSSYPWALSGDEGTFAVTARSFLRGELSNPFSSGPWGYPTMLFIFQGELMGLAGETVGASRMMSAVLGTGSVVAIYWLTRHHFGRWTGLVAAVIAATFNFHLFWSRNAQNAIASMFFIPLALLFLDRGLIGRSRVDSLAAGLVIGFAQFFHPANRILFPIALAYVAYAVIYPRPRSKADLIDSVRRVVPNALWVAAGAIVGHLPLLAYFDTHRTAFSDRTNQVSVFASGWLEREQEVTGKSALEILWIQFKNAAMLPFNTVPSGHYHPDVPVASWPLVIPLAIGMALVTVTFWQRRSFGLAVAFWATVVGIALTDGVPQTNRYTSSVPFLVIFAAVGIMAVALVLIQLVRLPRIPVAVLVTAITLLIGGWHLRWYFEDPNPVAVSSDPNTQIANYVAREAASLGPGATVYLAGVPRLTYGGFQNISYIAPNATGIDVVDPWSSSQPPPQLTGPTLFAFIPERLGELDAVRAWFPDGTTTISTLPNGEQILTTYFVDAPHSAGRTSS